MIVSVGDWLLSNAIWTGCSKPLNEPRRLPRCSTMTIDRMPGFLELAFVQQADQRTEFACEAHLIVRREGGVADRLHAKDVHDLFPAQAGTQLGPPRRPSPYEGLVGGLETADSLNV